MSAVHEEREPIPAGPSFHQAAAVARRLAAPPSRRRRLGLLATLAAVGLLGIAVAWRAHEGLGVSGLDQAVARAFGAASFAFWVGVGCGATLTLALLSRFRPERASSVRRTAEVTTLAALLGAGLFAILQLGRPRLLYWLAPFPNQMGIWPLWRSPELWLLVASGAFGVVAALRLWVDLHARRRRARRILAPTAGALALVVSALAAVDLAGAQLPGWHAAASPFGFLAGAVLAGAAMVTLLAAVAPPALGLESRITPEPLGAAGRVLPVAALLVGAAHLVDLLLAQGAGGAAERLAFENRAFGSSAWAWWTMVALGVVAPQLLWLERVRASTGRLAAIAAGAALGAWCERLVLAIGSLPRSLLPASWSELRPTPWDVATLLGGFGLFFALCLLLLRRLPAVAAPEDESPLPRADAPGLAGGAAG